MGAFFFDFCYISTMIDFRNAQYVTSAPEYALRPKDNLPEIVFIGKSNVGKSTLINLLTGQKLAYSSKSAGKTKLLNYFLIDKRFYLVDSPGYGYTAYGSKEDSNFAKMMEGYFENPQLKGAVLLVDSRRSLKEEEVGIASYMEKVSLPYILVFTKSDKTTQKERAHLLSDATSLSPRSICLTGLKDGREGLRKAVFSLLQ